jgi:Group XII secretory phospholipase A2 precursor (PLA2G12)
MKLFVVRLFPLLISTVTGAQIKLCVNKVTGGIVNAPPLPLIGASVKCWDEDGIDSDAVMTTTFTTGLDGCVTLTYTKLVADWFRCGWDCTPGLTNPDIFCKISKPGVIVDYFTPVKNNWNQDTVANFGTINVYPLRNCPSENGCGAEMFGSQIREGIDWLTGFHEQCDNHDCCYEDCDETQESCDDYEFRALMYSKCNDEYDIGSVLLATCKTSADVMYGVVDEFAGPNFAASRGDC